MELYKKTYPQGVPSGCIGMTRHSEATQTDINQWLAERNMCAVPIKYDSDLFDVVFTVFEETKTINLEHLCMELHEAMIKAAQESVDVETK